MTHYKSYTMLRVSCVLTLIGLSMCTWALLDPRPIPLILAMSAAQGIGTLAFLIYLLVIALELKSRGIFKKYD